MSVPSAEAETLRKLLEGKVAFLVACVNACMLWWVSSVVFCGSVLSTTYAKRNQITKLKNFNWFAGIVAVFFFTIVAFGFGVTYLMARERSQTADLLKMLNVQGDLYSTEFYIFQFGIMLGTTSFVLVLITWIGIWRHLRSEAEAESDKKT